METESIRILIREKLKDGRLPSDRTRKFWGGPGDREQCDACDTVIGKDQFVMEGMRSTRSNKKPIQFHVICFQLWDRERRELKS
jgi:hypothetical protein